MKSVGMDVHILNHFRLMQSRENGLDPVHHIMGVLFVLLSDAELIGRILGER
jgi:hypothetical protein